MQISHNWLCQFIQTDISEKKISEILTDTGLEVEGVHTYPEHSSSLEGVVVGEIISISPHPNADTLQLTTVDVGQDELLPIVCGAGNIAVGQKVPVATIGTQLIFADGTELKIKKSKIRGEVSMGMICAEDELGLGDSHEGIMVLSEDAKIGLPLEKHLSSYTDTVFEIGLTPNRSDAMSHYGVARDLNAALQNLKIKSTFSPIEIPALDLEENSNPFEVEIESPKDCVRYCGLFLENIQIKPSPDFIQNYLKAIGCKPINNVVDITNYILHSYGQPLHAFDANAITDKTIKIGFCKEGTQFITLDGETKTLSSEDLMIKDGKNNPMCFAGVFGGLHSGVTEKTKSIFLESAVFHPISVRKTAKNHLFSTDASFRFERGIDASFTPQALLIAAKMLVEYAGATITGSLIDQYPVPIQKPNILVRYQKIFSVLGIRIHVDQIKEILLSLGFEIVTQTDTLIEVLSPLYRADVLREIDVIEEIVRIYGYNSIEEPEKFSFTYSSDTTISKDYQLQQKAQQYFMNHGFFEVMNNSLKTFDEKPNVINLINPLSKELESLRTELFSGLLQNISFNQKRDSKTTPLFEFGKVYSQENGQIIEDYRLAVVISSIGQEPHWNKTATPIDFFSMKSILMGWFQRMGIQQLEETPFSDPLFSEGISIKYQGNVLAEIGMIKKEVLQKHSIQSAVYAFEIKWKECVAAYQTDVKVHEIPKYQMNRRDLAVLIDEETSYQDLYKAVDQLSIPEIKNIHLFDVYQGDTLPQGKKSYALSFYLQSATKTMTEKDIETIMTNIISIFQKEFKAELRT